ncbi:MAG TPA: class I SAM-dependent methyltransferase [Thermoanaerobaculia bacterium]|nr:class I SAM-dependent methyltransferase [Thermoanaerobaculia bacterium]
MSLARHSYRRTLVDQFLERHRSLLRGTMLDVGGRRAVKRGDFRPDEAAKVFYINIDESTRPDLLGDAHRLPLRAQSFDTVLCCETLEHVRDPRVCCAEAYDVLKPGGRFIFTVPFMYPVHADPSDYLRFTADGVRNMCRAFASVDVQPMGSWLGVLGMFTDFGARRISGGLHFAIVRKVLRAVGAFLCRLDARGVAARAEFTTGYFCIAVKG